MALVCEGQSGVLVLSAARLQGSREAHFDNWSPAATSDELEEIYDAVVKKKMPLASYLLMHPEGRLSQADRDALLAWADSKF